MKIWLEDIKKLEPEEEKESEEFHFIGSIICKMKPGTSRFSPEYLIIDGQQRITTFFLFSFAIHKLLKEDNNKFLFLGNKHRPRLIMRGEDKNSLEAIIEKHKNLKNSKMKILETYQWFKKELGGMNKSQLERYSQILKQRMKFILIELKEEDNALEIFKSINNSGEKLTSVNLIKTEFSIIYEEKGLEWGEKLDKEWENMSERVDKKNINNFFYNFLLTKYKTGGKTYGEKEFYNYFQEKLSQEKENIEVLWNEIVEKSIIYGQILNPQQEYWGEQFYLPVLEIKIMGLKRLYPLIIALKYKKTQEKRAVTILKKLIIYLFRKRIKEEQIQLSEILKWVNLVKDDELLESVLNDPKIIKETERSNIFWNELEQKEKLKDSEVKWLLTKFYLTLLPEGVYPSLQSQLEHIFPKTPDEWWLIPEWKDLEKNEKEIKKKLFSLGNVTLLTSRQNIASSNKTWEKKRKEFIKKTFLQYEKNELNLFEKSILLPKDIDERKKWLIKSFKETGILFIDEEKEKAQIEENSKN